MAVRRPAVFLSALTLASVALACERARVTPARDTTVATHPAPPPAAPPADSRAPAAPSPQTAVQLASTEDTTDDGIEAAASPVFPRDTAFLRRAVEAFAARSLYLHWAPDPADDGNDRVCQDPNDEGVYLNAAWGLGRARVTRVSFDDSAGARASAEVEIVRVLSIEGDPETSDGKYSQANMMVVRPVLDTIDLGFRRRRDGRWVQCDLYGRGEGGIPNPVSLTGPPAADTLAPREWKLTRVIPAGATLARVRALADSVEHSSPQPQPQPQRH
jgi:hypothetical protein